MKKSKYTNKQLMFEKHYILTGKLFLITASTVGTMYFVGSLLDSWYDFERTFKILGILLAFPIIQIIIYLILKK